MQVCGMRMEEEWRGRGFKSSRNQSPPSRTFTVAVRCRMSHEGHRESVGENGNSTVRVDSWACDVSVTWRIVYGC